MKVLITGAGGQVATALSARSPAGVELTNVARSELDIADPEQVRRVLTAVRPDAIINAAAYTAVDRAESEPERAREVNELGRATSLKIAAQIGARVIHLSTDFVFDGESSQPYAPDATTEPLSIYGKTKLAGEVAVSSLLPDRSVDPANCLGIRRERPQFRAHDAETDEREGRRARRRGPDRLTDSGDIGGGRDLEDHRATADRRHASLDGRRRRKLV